VIAYETNGTNFPGVKRPDGMNESDVFAYDVLLKKPEIVSVSPYDPTPDNESVYPKISADGNYVVYFSLAHNLIAEDLNQKNEYYITHLPTKLTKLVTVGLDGKSGFQPSNSSYDRRASLSGDGKYVCFVSNSTLLTPEGTGGVFVRDMVEGITKLVSINSVGKPETGEYESPQISDDGRYILFTSSSTLVPNPPHPWSIYIHDCQTEKTEVVPLSSQEGNSRRNLARGAIALSANGRYVAFCSGELLTDFGYNTKSWYPNQLYRYDRETGETRFLLKVTSLRNPDIINDTHYPYFDNQLAITPDGKTIVFSTNADDLVPEDTNSISDVYALDIEDSTSAVQDWSVR